MEDVASPDKNLHTGLLQGVEAKPEVPLGNLKSFFISYYSRRSSLDKPHVFDSFLAISHFFFILLDVRLLNDNYSLYFLNILVDFLRL